jgi:putative membrane protein
VSSSTNVLRLLADALPAGATSHGDLPSAAVKRSVFTPEMLLVWAHVGANLDLDRVGDRDGVAARGEGGGSEGARARSPGGSTSRRRCRRSWCPSWRAPIRTGMDMGYYFKQHHWMHGKLLFALVVIAIHHVLGARARKMEAGSMQEGGPSGMLTVVLAVSALAAFFVVLRFPDC